MLIECLLGLADRLKFLLREPVYALKVCRLLSFELPFSIDHVWYSSWDRAPAAVSASANFMRLASRSLRTTL